MLIGGDHTVHDTWRLVRFRLPFAVQRHFDGLRGTAVARATVALPTATRCWRFPYLAFHHFNWVVQILWPHNPSSSSIPILLRAVTQTLPKVQACTVQTPYLWVHVYNVCPQVHILSFELSHGLRWMEHLPRSQVLLQAIHRVPFEGSSTGWHAW